MAYRFNGFSFYWNFIQTYQKAACDGQAINLDCPSGTKIAIQLVQYGRSAPSSEVGILIIPKYEKNITLFFDSENFLLVFLFVF